MPRSRRRGRWQVARNGDQVRHPERPGSARGRRSPGGVNGPFPRRRRPPRPDLPPRGAADQVFTQFVFPPPARAAGARGRPHTCPPGPRSRSTGVAAPSAPSRCGKRGQQVRRWLERHGRRAVPPPPQRNRDLAPSTRGSRSRIAGVRTEVFEATGPYRRRRSRIGHEGFVHHLTLAILGLVKLPMSSRNS